MLKPICVKCRRFYKPHRNARLFVEGMPKGGLDHVALPGTSHPEDWQPYKIWCGDEWICRGCGNLIIVGTGSGPVKERYHEGFDEAVAKASYLTVNDC